MLLLHLPAGAAASPRVACLACHPAHYTERGGCTTCHRGNDRVGRKALAHRHLIGRNYASFLLPASLSRDRGTHLIDQFGCRRCHTIDRRGNRLATGLDRARTDLTVDDMEKAFTSPAFYMPSFGFTPAQRADIITSLLASDGRIAPARDGLTVVHFSDAAHDATDQFTRQCGPCHRLLSGRAGGIGRGDIGPNLSGLFSRYYPLRPGQRAWTPAALAAWVSNPRSYRQHSLMRPVPLTEPECRQILEMLAQ